MKAGHEMAQEEEEESLHMSLGFLPARGYPISSETGRAENTHIATFPTAQKGQDHGDGNVST